VPASAGRLAVSEAPAYFTVVADSIPGDPGVEAMVAPFRARMGDRINEVIGEAADPLSKAWPEGTLGNFAADAILEAARKRMAEPVHLALANNGGLRVPVPRGPVTVGKMFELMPFENMVAVVTLTGAQLQGLAREVALRGGEPVAGWSFRIEMEGDARVPRDLRVGGEPVDPKALYRLATSDYLANGGDELPSLTRAAERRDLPLLVRDALIEFVRERGVIRYGLEGRITGEVRR
jgi:2',3'-cyclic-nucleotide 2'-phosphodiesterase (5'-nucleotidase family)